MWVIRSSVPGRVKPVTYKIDTCHFLAWSLWCKEWVAQCQDKVTECFIGPDFLEATAQESHHEWPPPSQVGTRPDVTLACKTPITEASSYQSAAITPQWLIEGQVSADRK